MKTEYQITVNDSGFRTKRRGLHVVILFLGCFLVLFLLYSLLWHIGVIHDPKLEAYMPEAAFAISVFVTGMYEWIREKRTGGRSNLEFETTQQEYEKHLDFEETELFLFYDACRQAGIKCC